MQRQKYCMLLFSTWNI